MAPVPDNDRVLAGMFRCSVRKARALLRALVEAGKLTIENGEIWNDRARSDLFQRGFVSISRAESGAKGGRNRAINAAKALEEKEQTKAIASSREEKRREDTSKEGADAPPSLRKQVFDRGKAIFGNGAGGVINRWLRAHSEADVFGAIVAAEGKADPLAYATKALSNKAKADPDAYLRLQGIRDLDGGSDDTRGNFSPRRGRVEPRQDCEDDLSTLLPYAQEKARSVLVSEYVR
jgi:hypothetical protein